MRFTCVPGSFMGHATYCANWHEFEFTVNGKIYPSWRIRLIDDVQGMAQIFMVNAANEYIKEGPHEPPAFETVLGKVKIIGMPCQECTQCDQGVLAKKSWWTTLKR